MKRRRGGEEEAQKRLQEKWERERTEKDARKEAVKSN